ncbi:MAG TPA: hypothetical protein PLQ81_05900 [bacterium]|nr:hypothetical protein [bacterium]
MILKVCVLFGIAILLAFLFSKKKEKFDAEPVAEIAEPVAEIAEPVAEIAEPQKKKRNPALKKAKK